MKTVDISHLMEVSGIDQDGSVQISPDMSGLEEDPKDDWLYLGLKSFKHLADHGYIPRSAAVIGSANGIDVIGLLKLFPSIKKLYVTDLLPDILPLIIENVMRNTPYGKVEVHYLSGRDCEPLPEKVDFIYGNLPLIMVEPEEIGAERSTTTLTDASYYRHLKEGQSDQLDSYSLLSQLGFILSAKKKLNEGGKLVTLIGGRVPALVIADMFVRAGVHSQRLFTAFMRQSDPEFLEQYADIERDKKVFFTFYDYASANWLLNNRGNKIKIPGIIDKPHHEIALMLRLAEINAWSAYRLYEKGCNVGHLAYSLLVTV